MKEKESRINIAARLASLNMNQLKEVINQYPQYVYYTNRNSEQWFESFIKENLIKVDPRYLKNPSNDLLLYIIKLQPDNIEIYFKNRFDNLDENLKCLIIQKRPDLKEKFTEMTYKMLLTLCQSDPMAVLQYTTDIEILSKAIFYNDEVFFKIKNPHRRLEEEFVKSNGNNIQYIKKQDKKLQKLALESSITSFKYFKNPCYEIKKLAILNFPNNIQYIKNPSKRLLHTFIKYHPLFISKIDNLDSDLIDLAVKEIMKKYDSFSYNRIKKYLYDVEFTKEQKKYIIDNNFLGFTLLDIENDWELQMYTYKKYGRPILKYLLLNIENINEELVLECVRCKSDLILERPDIINLDNIIYIVNKYEGAWEFINFCIILDKPDFLNLLKPEVINYIFNEEYYFDLFNSELLLECNKDINKVYKKNFMKNNLKNEEN